jgi:hypothetical protein
MQVEVTISSCSSLRLLTLRCWSDQVNERPSIIQREVTDNQNTRTCPGAVQIPSSKCSTMLFEPSQLRKVASSQYLQGAHNREFFCLSEMKMYILSPEVQLGAERPTC